MKRLLFVFSFGFAVLLSTFVMAEDTPRIVNIVNFIRQLEPRNAAITEDVLYNTVAEQINVMTKHQFVGTFLLQYDALINPHYQTLLKKEAERGSEIGAWWEITQPHVEAAGLKWRGRFAWDWHANVGFATGYTPEERKKLVDIYMAKFKEIFGHYPASVGSWFIDAYTLAYLSDEYHITASCNCKDQIGTDGYTLWGGYWNQAYYPSRKNGYMPAQHETAQIPVPVFRMLGSDPIYQYDSNLGSHNQGVISLEPVYGHAGGNRKWVEWFFKSMFSDPCLGFNYVQAGQENSFTWAKMKNGFVMQMELLETLKNEGKIRIETLENSGRWFKKHYSVTPPTGFSALSDCRNQNNKTIWFNSRFYRVNLIWEGDAFRFRDIYLFDERYESEYLTKAGTSTQVIYNTLPILDGFRWSVPDNKAGLRFIDAEGKNLTAGDPTVTTLPDNVLKVSFSASGERQFEIVFHEDRVEISSNKNAAAWKLELTTAKNVQLPFQTIEDKKIQASQNGFDYSITCKQGTFQKSKECVFQIIPDNNKITINTKTSD
ncbi:MAG: hypothetical protein LBP87_12090 [Planctomycetaceae bacterium]|jgi:hypothetical protein|nr:hypothetical protein [Planctomycetaceae bacterium]